EHPTLSVVVRDHLSNAPWFVRLPSVDLTKVIRVTTIQNAQEVGSVMQDENNHPFDLTDWSVPLWRLIVVRVESDGSFYLLYTYHHAIGDGRSGMSLTEQLYERINIAAREADKNADLPLVVAAPQDKAMLPALEQRADCNPGFKMVMKGVVPHLLLPKALRQAMEPKFWAGELDAQPEHKNVTELTVFQLTREETALVAQTAKRHQNTVQSMLFAAGVFALQSCFIYPRQLAEDNAVDSAQRFSTPVAMRDLLGDQQKIPRTDQGVYTCEHLYDVVIRPKSSFWKVASDYRRSVIKATQTPSGVQDLLQHTGMLKYVPNHPGGWEEFFQSQYDEERHGRRASLMISNLGRGWEMCQWPEDSQEDLLDAYVVEDAIFSQSCEKIGVAFACNVATANGVLTATNVWQKSAFHGRERGEWFTRETKRVLLQACQPNLPDLTFQEAFNARESCL
ncbi:hypothetical protein BGZ73_000485, partial [Actinomortierella ambigua]